jgi:glutathione-independent formaldehyde dehydrogenase
MKAVVYQEPYNVTVEDVEDPRFEDPRDANVRITSTAICGSDLHMYEGRTGAESGLVFGHENLGIVEDVGDGVTQIKPGDRVIVPFNVACGFCRNCERGNTGFCLNAQEGFAGGAYGYVSMGPYRGGQAEYLRVPWADFNCVLLPEGPSGRTTSCSSPTFFRPAITAVSSRSSPQGRRSRSTEPAPSGSWQHSLPRSAGPRRSSSSTG